MLLKLFTEVFILPFKVHLRLKARSNFPVELFFNLTPEQNNNLRHTFRYHFPLLSNKFFTLYLDGCQDIGLESLVWNGASKQKQNEFLKTANRFGK